MRPSVGKMCPARETTRRDDLGTRLREPGMPLRAMKERLRLGETPHPVDAMR
ncbi:MAG TPA: hypothetical protein VHS09_14655 [Polyangiaceae bacterium]|jgi:hypothetical protein|nr:hypothetical protein [Polyangiaceae bacterium]